MRHIKKKKMLRYNACLIHTNNIMPLVKWFNYSLLPIAFKTMYYNLKIIIIQL